MGHFHWGKEPQKLLGNFFLLPLKVLESPYETTTFHQRISPKPVGQKKNILSFIESNTADHVTDLAAAADNLDADNSQVQLLERQLGGS